MNDNTKLNEMYAQNTATERLKQQFQSVQETIYTNLRQLETKTATTEYSNQMFHHTSVLRNDIKIHQVPHGRPAVGTVPRLLNFPHVDYKLLHFTRTQCSPDHYL